MVCNKIFNEYKTMVSPCLYAGLITFLLSRNVSWRCEDAAILQARRGTKFCPPI
ncbi:hypothetical protein HMPREF9530_00408 [Escherichia coli MS 21-1]|nr:hypothetical protein HMPREF9530_00408 [Escherichia coli MS 21-1]ESA78470.1 hypothetical protein HMPREF1599_05808 [Escherichia coli 907713]ESD47199.1 hypothetical protein HMPREF1605_04554 [Escherichia coli 908521]ESD61978.1 hypothetical protein HMPREF1606_00616 [Escherichia coli 908522]